MSLPPLANTETPPLATTETANRLDAKTTGSFFDSYEQTQYEYRIENPSQNPKLMWTDAFV